MSEMLRFPFITRILLPTITGTLLLHVFGLSSERPSKNDASHATASSSDQIHLMEYDEGGGWSSSTTFNSPLDAPRYPGYNGGDDGAGGESAYSTASHFGTVVAPPAVPALQSPGNGTACLTTPVTMSWNA